MMIASSPFRLSVVALVVVAVSFAPAAAQLFQATYRGRFQHWKSLSSCTGPPPLLRLKCLGTDAVLQVTETSHPTIVCTNQNNSQALCTNTCEEDECNEIWAEVNGARTFHNGIYGNITFTCTSETSVDAQFVYVDNGDGECTYSFNLRNYHFAQLGIFCSDADDFVFDGNFFQCNPPSISINAGRRLGSHASVPDADIYACYSGDICEWCTIDFDPVKINVDEHRLRDECILSLDGAPISTPPAPLPLSQAQGEYSARFKAEWALAYRYGISVCTSAVWNVVDPIFTVQCLNGPITLIEKLFETVECVQESDNTLTCSESSVENFVYSGYASDGAKYSGIVYVSTLPYTLLILSIVCAWYAAKANSSIFLLATKKGVHGSVGASRNQGRHVVG